MKRFPYFMLLHQWISFEVIFRSMNQYINRTAADDRRRTDKLSYSYLGFSTDSYNPPNSSKAADLV